MPYLLRPCAILLLLAALSGCASPLYYAQAVNGEFEMLAKRRPIEEVLADPATPLETKRQLELVLRLRDFATRALLLPDNRSFRTYADLARPYVVWDVLATPELSLKPRQWCFIVAGCVPYRGYFTRAAADQFAAKLTQKGYDVYVGGVPAYSTLGWFNDPVLNTFIHRSEADLAGLLFHELAHQKLYVRGDTAFNESFATAVELEGIRRWFQQNGAASEAADYLEKIKRREEFFALVLQHRARLAEVYASKLSDADKRAAKAREYAALRRDYALLKTKWNGDTAFDNWFKPNLNNAQLAAIGLYSQYIPAFQTLLAQQGGNLADFYRAVEKIANLPKVNRAQALQSLSEGPTEALSFAPN